MYIVTGQREWIAHGVPQIWIPGWPSRGTALGADLAQDRRTLEEGLRRGIRGENELTNLVFHARHPERQGRPLAAGELGFELLRREWLDVRDGFVRPVLVSSPVPAAAPSAPTARTPPPASRACPVPTQVAKARCIHPGTRTCPAIPDLMCVTRVEGVPFVRPDARRVDPASGLVVVTRRTVSITQRFVPSVATALSRFVRNMASFGMPIEAILTSGSLYCRCISNRDDLSNHSFGDAIDIAGVRWVPSANPGSVLPESVVDNFFGDRMERRLLVRINACLRLSFATVIDYHRADHRDHFHCDTNRGRGRPICKSCRSTWTFVQEALETVLGRTVSHSGILDQATQDALARFAGLPSFRALDIGRATLDPLLGRLFTQVASTGRK